MRSILFSILACVWLLPVGCAVAAEENEAYDFTKDFSAAKNPSGPWTIGTFNHIYSGKADELKNLSAYGKLTFTKTATPYSGGGLQGWGNISSGLFSSSASGVFKNTATAAKYSIPAGSIGVFPQNGPIVVRWIAPRIGTVMIRANFVDLTFNAGAPEIWLLQNHDVTKPLHYEKAYGDTGKVPLHLIPITWGNREIKKTGYKGSIAVAADDTIDFVVDPMYTVFPGHSEHPEGDSTDIIGMSAVITYTPEGSAAD